MKERTAQASRVWLIKVLNPRNEVTLDLRCTDPEQLRRLVEFISLAEEKRFGINLSLIEYEGQPDMVEQAKARAEKRKRRQQEPGES